MGDKEFLIGMVRKFKENSKGFFRAYRWFIAVFIIALLCDAISTIRFMSRGGMEMELHPVVRAISSVCGPVCGPIIAALSKAVAGIGVAILLRKYAAYIFIAVSMLSFWAGWYNVWGQLIYTPIIFKFIFW